MNHGVADPAGPPPERSATPPDGRLLSGNGGLLLAAG